MPLDELSWAASSVAAQARIELERPAALAASPVDANGHVDELGAADGRRRHGDSAGHAVRVSDGGRERADREVTRGVGAGVRREHLREIGARELANLLELANGSLSRLR